MTTVYSRRAALGALAAVGSVGGGVRRGGDVLRVGSQRGGTKAMLRAFGALAGVG